MINIRIVLLFSCLLLLTGCLTLYQSGFPKQDAKRCIQVGEDKSLNEQAFKMKSLYEKKDYLSLLDLTKEIINRYSKEATDMQNSLSEYPWESKSHVFRMGTLNLVSLTYFWQVKANVKLNEPIKAQESAQILFEDFYYGQCLTDQSVFAKPSEALKEYEKFPKVEKRGE